MVYPFTNDNGVVFLEKTTYETRNGNLKVGFKAMCPRCNEEFITTEQDYKSRRSCRACQPRLVAEERIAKSAPMYIRQIRNGMMQRCTNPKNKGYPSYGGRGIQVCARWSDVKTGALNMYKDLGARPGEGIDWSIDRIDNDGDYEPSNCKWSSRSEQRVNQRQKANYSIQVANNGKFSVEVYYEGKHYLGTYSTRDDALTSVNGFYKTLEKLNGKTIRTLKLNKRIIDGN